jgi:hypothetical protein
MRRSLAVMVVAALAVLLAIAGASASVVVANDAARPGQMMGSHHMAGAWHPARVTVGTTPPCGVSRSKVPSWMWHRMPSWMVDWMSDGSRVCSMAPERGRVPHRNGMLDRKMMWSGTR